MSNLEIWNAVSKTDPKHTKQFSRAGGFKGTAIKPIWIVKRLTEQFGPVGMGWGMRDPQFQVVPAGDEMMVYCTVTCWHTTPDNAFVGVGGDKVTTKRQSGAFNDDEAFKKAFTDAVGNAFKFVGLGADVHMGQFEDSKYLREVTQEFSEKPANDAPAPRQKLAGPHTSKTALQTAIRGVVHNINGCGDLDQLECYLDSEEAKATIEQCKRDMPNWFHGWPEQPDGFTPLGDLIADKRLELATPDFIHEQAAVVGGAG